jgi:ATP-dependent DNA ligase
VTLGPSDFKEGLTVQRKLDGVRNLARLEGGAVLLSSRTGGAYPGQGHISEDLARLFALAPEVDPAGVRGLGAAGQPAYSPPRPYLDGELYKFGKPLNWISGQARRGDDAGELEFHVFDVVFPHAKTAGLDMASRDRQAYLDAWFARARDAGLDLKHVKRVENFPAASMGAIEALAGRFLAEGYEGAIVRRDGAGYRYSYSNYHSDNALKFKPKFDDEFPVVGFTQGTRGKDVGAVIWVCAVPHPVDPADAEFATVPKDMSYEDRYRLFECLGQVVEGGLTRFERDFRGRPLTVEHAGLSAKTGKPLQAKGKAFRTYEAGPDADPVRKAFRECLG